jgi:WD40 repeat protein
MGHRSALALLLLLMGLVLPADAADGSDPAAPILRIETGMHGAVINRLALADDGRELLTVSDDKTTRRWALADGGARAVWRTPIGDGDQGALYAVAVSQDTVVVGGRTGGSTAALYVLDRRSGQMRGSIGGFAEAISALAFSPNGHYLAVGLQGHGGLTLIDFTQRKLAGEDRDYGGTIEWIAFAADGRLATSSADGEVRLYDEHLKLTAAAAFVDAAAGERPWGLAFSPDGARLAVGSVRAAKIRLFAGDLTLERTLDGAPSRSGALSVVAWSADGAALAAAGSYKDGERRLVRFWHLQGKDIAAGRDAAVARDTVTDLALLGDGRLVYVTAEPSFGIVAEDGKSTVRRDAGKADFRDAWRDAFRVSPDGAVVDFPSEPGGKRRFRFDLVEGVLTPDPPPRSELKRAVLEDDRRKVTDWQNGVAPKLNGRAITLDQGERVHSIAILAGTGDVALGTDFYVRLEHAGAEGWRNLVPAPAWSVNASGDGRYVLAALGDGTIHWYAAADGSEVMTLFVDPRDGRWVAWTPEGFFDHSRAAGARGGETLVGYQLNNGPNKAADFVEIGQLYNLFYRRDLVLAKFRGGAAGGRSIAQQLARIGDVRSVLKNGLPPRLELVEGCIRPAGTEDCAAGTAIKPTDPADRRAAITGRGSELFARYRIVDRGGGLGRVILRRNGAVIDGVPKVEGADAQHRVESVTLALDPAGDEVRLASVSQSAAIQSRDDDDVVIDATPSAAPAALEPATALDSGVQLFVLAIGVSQYRQPEFRLANAAHDARAVAELLRKPTPPVYDKADVAMLLDDEATAPKIIQALQQIAAKARPQDLVVIFLSGHGESVDGKYFFAPVDFATRHPERLAEAKGADSHREAEIVDELFRLDGIGEAQLFPLLAKIQGNLLLVLDTCYSATLATRDAVEQKARNETVANSVGHEIGRFILAGARSLALDSSGDTTTHGLFTEYLLKGLDGEADLQHNGRINVAELLMFTKTRVHEESRKLNLDQEPFYYFSGSNFFEIRAVANR